MPSFSNYSVAIFGDSDPLPCLYEEPPFDAKTANGAASLMNHIASDANTTSRDEDDSPADLKAAAADLQETFAALDADTKKDIRNVLGALRSSER